MQLSMYDNSDARKMERERRCGMRKAGRSAHKPTSSTAQQVAKDLQTSRKCIRDELVRDRV